MKKSASQYKALLAMVRPRDLAGKTRRRMAAGELADSERLDAKLKAMKAELKAVVLASGSRLMDLHGVGLAGAARFWPTSVMWPGFPAAATSRPGMESRRSMPPAGSTSGTGYPAPATGASTTCSTWPASSGSAVAGSPTMQRLVITAHRAAVISRRLEGEGVTHVRRRSKCSVCPLKARPHRQAFSARSSRQRGAWCNPTWLTS